MPIHVTHRQDATAENYKGIPIHAAPGLHEALFEITKLEIKSLPGITLDIAAGSGAFAQRLYDGKYPVVANELFINEKTWLADKEISVLNVDLNHDFSKEFKEKEVSHIVAIEVIEHLENPEHFIRNCYESIPKGGKIIISTPNVHNFYSIYKFITQGELFLFNYDYFFSTGHRRITPLWLFEAMLKNMGIENYSITPLCTFRDTTFSQKIFTTLLRIFLSKKQKDLLNFYCLCVVIRKT